MLSVLGAGLGFLVVLHPCLAKPNVVSLPISKGRENDRVSRRDPFDTSLLNYIPGNQFFATVLIGTPPQKVELLVDTGSSDTWMYAPDACKGEITSPCLGGSFDPDMSSSYKNISGMGYFSSRYGDNSTVSGPFFSDTFGMGGQAVGHLTMGLANASTGAISSGIVGLGLASNEAIASTKKPPYRNLPDMLVQEGLIDSKAYSLYLDSLGSKTGNVLFGGYDVEKYTGDIVMFPIQRDQQTGRRNTFTISLTGFGTSFKSSTSIIRTNGYPYAVLLDSGTNHIHLGRELFEPFVELFHLKCQPDFSSCFVDCDINKFVGEGTLDFHFGSLKTGQDIAVPFSELAVPVYNAQTGEQYKFHKTNQLACQFGVLPAPSGFPNILGQPFLRSAYVLYDLDNLAVGLAQAQYNEDRSSNVHEYSTSKPNKRIKTDLHEPAALQTYDAKAPARTLASVTTYHTIPTAFDISQPTNTPPTAQPTGLLAQEGTALSLLPAFPPLTGCLTAVTITATLLGVIFSL